MYNPGTEAAHTIIRVAGDVGSGLLIRNLTTGQRCKVIDLEANSLLEGQVLELDRDELEEALQNGAISRAQYERTLSEGAKVRACLEAHAREVEDFIRREYQRLKAYHDN